MRTALALLAPPAIWAAQFMALYGPKAFLCSRGAPDIYFLYAVIVSLIAIAGLIGFAGFRVRAGLSALFLDRAVLALSLLALVAAVWTALPLALIPVCTPPMN